VDDGTFLFTGNLNNHGNNNLIITKADNYGKDHDHDTQSPDPTVFFHSDTNPDTDNTQWGSLAHDKTNFVIGTGSGDVVLNGIGGTTVSGVLTVNNTISTPPSTSLKLTPGTNGITIVGTGSPGVISGAGALYVEGHLEVDGSAFLDSHTYVGGNLGVTGNASVTGTLSVTSGATFSLGVLSYGTLEVQASIAALQVAWGSTYNDRYGGVKCSYDDGTFLCTGSSGYGNNNFIVTSYSNYQKDHDHETPSTDPTMFFHSATSPDSDNTQWLSITHDKTDGLISSGKGNIKVSPTESFETNGGIQRKITTVSSASHTTALTEHIIHVTYTATGAVTVTLATATTRAGQEFVIKDAGGNASGHNITIATEGAQTIDGAASATISGDYDSVSVYSCGSHWHIF
jgi:hypothetical protein